MNRAVFRILLLAVFACPAAAAEDLIGGLKDDPADELWKPLEQQPFNGPLDEADEAEDVGGDAAGPAKTRKVEARDDIAVFNFESFGDDNELGAWVANNIRRRIERKQLYVLLEPMDMDGIIFAHRFKIAFDSPLKAVADFTREKLGCSLAMWGCVDIIGESLAINVKVITTGENPTIVLDDKFIAENRYVTQLTVQEMLRRLAGEPEPVEQEHPEWDKAWEDGPNLVKNPGFEDGEESPANWDVIGSKDYHHGMVSWVDAPGPDGHGKCIKFEMNTDIAGSYGVAYYSDPIDTSEGTRYRFSVRVMSMAPAVKIFIKHYAWFPSRGNETEGQWRETRRAPMDCYGAGPAWKTFTRDFNPRLKDHGYNTTKDLDKERAKLHDPKITKIDLYAYWPAGTVYFDDVVLKRLE